MIYDTIENIALYKGLEEGVYKALTILRDTDFSTMEAGKYPIDGDKLFMMIQSYTTKPLEAAYCEAHKKYIDVQCMLEGSEYMGVAPMVDMTQERVQESRPEGDIWFYDGEYSAIPMKPGRFAVLYPQDAHAPAIASGEPTTVCKVIIKVAI